LEKVLYVDDRTGVIDLVVNPVNPDILYAATYEKERTAWNYEPGGEKSRIYRSIDGGKNWNVLSGGLPSGPLGRIGLDIHRADPDVVVAVIQNLNVKPGVDPDAPVPFDEFTDHSFDNLIGGEVYITRDGGMKWKRINDPEKNDVSGKAAYSFNRIAIDPLDPIRLCVVGMQWGCSTPSMAENTRPLGSGSRTAFRPTSVTTGSSGSTRKIPGI
jgi:hypothetical protein